MELCLGNFLENGQVRGVVRIEGEWKWLRIVSNCGLWY